MPGLCREAVEEEVDKYFRTGDTQLDRTIWEKRILIYEDSTEFRPLIPQMPMNDPKIHFYTLLYRGADATSGAVWQTHYLDNLRDKTLDPFTDNGSWSIQSVLETNYPASIILTKKRQKPPKLDEIEIQIHDYFNEMAVPDTIWTRLVEISEMENSVRFLPVDLIAAQEDGNYMYDLRIGQTPSKWAVTKNQPEPEHFDFSNNDPDTWSVPSVLRKLYTPERIKRHMEKIERTRIRQQRGLRDNLLLMIQDLLARCERLLLTA